MLTSPIAIVTLAVGLIFGFIGLPLWAWTLALAGLIVWAGWPIWAMVLLAIPAVVFNLRPLRAMLVSDRIGRALLKLGLLPRISDTERTALEAGTVWMDGELFSGKPDLRKIAESAWTPDLRDDEKAFLDGPVDEVCRLTDEWRNWRDKDLPPEIWDFLKRHRFFGMIIAKEYGGLGLSASGVSAVIHKLASRSFPVSVTVMIPNSLGPAELISHYGTDQQKKEYLPKLATGEHMPCFALTEPTAGSDAGSLRATGRVFKDAGGKLMMRLDFSKRYTSLATVSTVVGLAFRLLDPDELLGRGKDLGITCALVPTPTPGIEVGRRHDPLGVPFHNNAISGENVIVPLDCIIGGPERAGQGWRMLMECLAAGRGVTLPASSVANVKIAALVAGAYSTVRQQFGLSIGKFEGIEEPLARLAGDAWLLEAARVWTAGAISRGEKPSVVSAILKYHFTETSRARVNDAMDVVAGAGISRGPRNVLAQCYIAAPIGITVEGANILTRSMIIFGQGAMRCHPYARAEVEALEKGDRKAFDRALWGHFGHLVRNLFRVGLLSISRGFLALPPVQGPTARWWRKLSWASASFAVAGDLAMIGLGGDLKRREKLTGRLGDMLSWMLMGAAALRRFEAEGRRDEDRAILDYVMESVFARLQTAHEGICRNMPVPFLSGFMAGPAAIWSRLNSFGSGPSDAQGARVAAILRSPSPARDRLLGGLFVSKDPQDGVGRIENALALTMRAQEVLQKVREASKSGRVPKGRPEELVDAAFSAGAIDAVESALVRDAVAAREDAVQVDAFPAADFARLTPVPGTELEPEHVEP